MSNPGKRLKILNKSEIQELYGLPDFTHEERVMYFSLDSLENKELENLRSNLSKVYFILQM